MNPWEILGTIVGWTALALVVLVLLLMLYVIIGVLVGLFRKKTHNITTLRSYRRNRG